VAPELHPLAQQRSAAAGFQGGFGRHEVRGSRCTASEASPRREKSRGSVYRSIRPLGIPSPTGTPRPRRVRSPGKSPIPPLGGTSAAGELPHSQSQQCRPTPPPTASQNPQSFSRPQPRFRDPNTSNQPPATSHRNTGYEVQSTKYEVHEVRRAKRAPDARDPEGASAEAFTLSGFSSRRNSKTPKGPVSRKETAAVSQLLPVRCWSCPLSGTPNVHRASRFDNHLKLGRFRDPAMFFPFSAGGGTKRIPFMSFPCPIVAV
jgi:hypothetical protein